MKTKNKIFFCGFVFWLLVFSRPQGVLAQSCSLSFSSHLKASEEVILQSPKYIEYALDRQGGGFKKDREGAAGEKAPGIDSLLRENPKLVEAVEKLTHGFLGNSKGYFPRLLKMKKAKEKQWYVQFQQLWGDPEGGREKLDQFLEEKVTEIKKRVFDDFGFQEGRGGQVFHSKLEEVKRIEGIKEDFSIGKYTRDSYKGDQETLGLFLSQNQGEHVLEELISLRLFLFLINQEQDPKTTEEKLESFKKWLVQRRKNLGPFNPYRELSTTDGLTSDMNDYQHDMILHIKLFLLLPFLAFPLAVTPPEAPLLFFMNTMIGSGTIFLLPAFIRGSFTQNRLLYLLRWAQCKAAAPFSKPLRSLKDFKATQKAKSQFFKAISCSIENGSKEVTGPMLLEYLSEVSQEQPEEVHRITKGDIQKLSEPLLLESQPQFLRLAEDLVYRLNSILNQIEKFQPLLFEGNQSLQSDLNNLLSRWEFEPEKTPNPQKPPSISQGEIKQILQKVDQLDKAWSQQGQALEEFRRVTNRISSVLKSKLREGQNLFRDETSEQINEISELIEELEELETSTQKSLDATIPQGKSFPESLRNSLQELQQGEREISQEISQDEFRRALLMDSRFSPSID